jgi:hypothetical protein
MKKIIRISESQLLNLASKKKTIMEMEMSPAYREHWEHKFEKSIEILLKLGHTPDELTEKISLIATKQQINESYKIGNHEFSVLKLGHDTIYVGEDGILGDNRVVIPWEIINKLIKKYIS